MSQIPPLVLVAGPEQLLADRAVKSVVDAAREAEPDAEVVRLDGFGYEAGTLALHASPSLFGGRTIVVVRGLEVGTEALVDDVVKLASAPVDGAIVVVTHKGGNRGKRALDALKKAKARVIDAPAMKNDKDKTAFVRNEFRVARRKIDEPAVRALLDAAGSDLSGLASACQQLISDTEGVVDEAVVEKYYSGKVEATGFKIADAIVAGRTQDALRLTRHALATGATPVALVGALAMQLRQVAKVASAGRGASPKALGMAPWQIDRARRASQGWDGDRLGRAIQAVAAADFEIKGAGRDPVYALERALITIGRERNQR